MITIETRIPNQAKLAVIGKVNQWLSCMMRMLFVLIFVKGMKRNEAKKHFGLMGLGSTHFNSLLNQLDGKAKAILELNKIRATELGEAIKATAKTISKKESKLKKTIALIKHIENHKRKVQAWRSHNNLSDCSLTTLTTKRTKSPKKKPVMPKFIRGLSLEILRNAG